MASVFKSNKSWFLHIFMWKYVCFLVDLVFEENKLNIFVVWAVVQAKPDINISVLSKQFIDII